MGEFLPADSVTAFDETALLGAPGRPQGLPRQAENRELQTLVGATHLGTTGLSKRTGRHGPVLERNLPPMIP